MRENKGFTLVEILVTIAILSIVTASVATFIITGSRSFSKGSADAAIQKEAQLAVNQVEDLIIDINGGVDFDADKKELILYNAQSSVDGTGYFKEVVTWKAEDKQLTYSKWNVVYDASSDEYITSGDPIYSDELLAEHVESFSVDLTDIDETRSFEDEAIYVLKSVRITVGYMSETGTVAYATSPIITLRNKLLKGASPKIIFDNTPTEEDTTKLYISDTTQENAVEIQDRVTTVERTKLYHVFAMVNAGSCVNDYVDFSIEETGTSSTILADGSLQVGEYETNEYLTITATYKSNATKRVSAVVKVIGGASGKDLVGVSILTESLIPFKASYSSYVTTEGFTEEERTTDLNYKWTVTDADKFESFTDNGPTLSLNAIKNIANYGKNVTITLTVSSTLTGKSVSDSVVYMIDTEGTTGGDSNLKRGRTNQSVYAYSSIAGESYVTYTKYFCDKNGEKISGQDQYLGYITVIGWNGGFNLSFDKGVPWDQEFYFCVEATGKNSNGDIETYKRILYIPRVQLFGSVVPDVEWQGTCTRYNYHFTCSGFFGDGINSTFEITVEDVQAEAGEGTTVSAKATNVWQMSGSDNSDLGGEVAVSISGAADTVHIKSIKVGIKVKDYPTIYTESTILFKE